MTVAYFDSSVLLAMLLQEARETEAGNLWKSLPTKVSSLLLSAECWVSLRRHFLRNGKEPSEKWLKERDEFLTEALAGIELKRMDEETLTLLKGQPILADCRTLDAIHLATAL